jgi:cobalt-zinc-cadmium efflux system outer membrane protein
VVRRFLVPLTVVGVMAGCRSAEQIRDPEYARVSGAVAQAWAAPDPAAAVAPVLPELAGPHRVEEYIRFALTQNPDIQAARKRMEAFAHQVPVAASLQDPMLNVTAQPAPVQTAAGRQQAIVSANQKFPWLGKLGTRAAAAGSQADVARAELAAIELATIEKVKRAYYELYFIQRTIDVTEAEQKLLVDIRAIADSRYKTKQTNQQDVLRADVEVANIESELIRLRQQLASGQARLAALLHIAPQTGVLAVTDLAAEQAPRDLEALQRQAVAARPELQAQLAAIERDRRVVELARLDYKPDVTLGVSWIDVANAGISPVANGQNAVLLTAGVNLPVYRRRLDASLRSAEAMAVSSARQYDALRDGTLEEVTDLFAKARSQQDLLTVFGEDIIPKARQTLNVSTGAYNVGEVDFLQLLDNWQQLLRYEVAYRRLEASLRQTLAELERVVGGFAPMAAAQGAAPERMEPLPPP